jgi:hypothetical protein
MLNLDDTEYDQDFYSVTQTTKQQISGRASAQENVLYSGANLIRYIHHRSSRTWRGREAYSELRTERIAARGSHSLLSKFGVARGRA